MTKPNWINIEPSTLSAEQQTKYETYKSQYRVMKAAREDFEASMQVGTPEGQRIVCGYNFGKLSVALVEDDRKPKAQAKAPVTLAQYLAMQIASGRPS